MQSGPLDSWEQWRRGTPATGFDPSTRTFPGDIAEYGQIPSARYTSGHSTSSLARVKAEDIERSTKIVSVEAASHLAGYEDPIKLVLPPVIQEANVVYVKRKFAVGNTATEVPERAPAPVVSVQEETRRVTLRRFGGDIDFNVNACAVPDLFKKEMDLKVGAQHAALADRLVALGYDALINEGTDFTSALMRSNHGLDADVRQRARRFYFEQVFGTLSTNPYPIHNLLAAAKRCTAYDISKSLKSVLILPHGVPEMMSYARAENMRYEINGISGPQGKPITMKVENGYQIPATTASVFVHIPPARHLHGSAAPVAGHNSLEETVGVYHTYDRHSPDDDTLYHLYNEPWDGGITNRDTFPKHAHNFPYYVDIMNRTHRSIGNVDAGLLYSVSDVNNKLRTYSGMNLWIFTNCENIFNPIVKALQSKTSGDTMRKAMAMPRQMVQKIVSTEINTMHAILATPGEETGNLLMQYPRSTVSADASTESGRMQLRVYMGAVLKRPENVLVMRNVAFNGVRTQHMLGCVESNVTGVQRAPLTESMSEMSSEKAYQRFETQPCLFPSSNTLSKFGPTTGLEDLDGSYEPLNVFLSKLDSSGNLIEQYTGFKLDPADLVLDAAAFTAGDATRFERLIERSAFDHKMGATDTDGLGKLRVNYTDVGLLFPDYYPSNITMLPDKNDVPNKDTDNIAIDPSSTVLRTVLLNSSDKALEDQAALDHELRIDETLSHLYCDAVREMRDKYLFYLNRGYVSGVCGPFCDSDLAAPFSPETTAAFGRSYWVNAGTDNDEPLIKELGDTRAPSLAASKSTRESAKIENSMHWLHYLATPGGADNAKLTNAAALKDIIVKGARNAETGVNCPKHLNQATFDLKQQELDNVSALTPGECKLEVIVSHMNKLISFGLEHTELCAKVLYLFCLITKERNIAMANEKYRFGDGSQYILNKDEDAVAVAPTGAIKSRLYNPPRAVIPTKAGMNLIRNNSGQFKMMDDLEAVDRFSGISLQRYDPQSATQVGL